ncbi:hypothetical protein [Effusibacillus pohliae]|uniref:hypothetical protein n=1 Tax=Effusibacillus pohliae TaxID=232270 RepID=UPI00039D8440|nr:hypothetical protein [Effusibacillus pohliae]
MFHAKGSVIVLQYSRIAAAVCLYLLCLVDLAGANGLPVSLESSPSAMLVPDANSKIEVVAEELTFDFRPPAAPSDASPLVTAKYRLKNPSPQAAPLKVAFLYLKPAADIKATWNGQDVPMQPPGPDMPQGWQPPQGLESINRIDTRWLNPSTGETYANKTVYANGLHTALFPLTVAGGSEGELVVTYHQEATACDACNDSRKRMYHFTYLLSPAGYWSSFQNLSIRVIAPPNLAIATQPQLDVRETGEGGRILSGYFSSLPDSEFFVSVHNRSIAGTPFPVGSTVTLLLLATGTWMLLRRAKMSSRQ